jgi:cytochrome c553
MVRAGNLLAVAVSLALVVAGVRHAAAGPLDAPGAAKALVCSACHGFAGQSPSDTMPVIAGMPPDYFKKAIRDYAAGKRPSPEMEPYSKMVLQFGLDEIAAYFAAQPRRPTAMKVDAAAAARGKALAAQCVLCHGPDGRGDPTKGIPDLQGQPPGYLRNQMVLFKADQRSPGDDVLKPLKALFKTLPDEAFADLAAYYSSLR